MSFLGRIGICLLALSIIYLHFGPPSYEEVDMLNSIFYLMIIPLILIGGTIIICFLVGSPIRLIPTVYSWWFQRPYIPLIGLTMGILFCLFSNNSNYVEIDTLIINGEEITQHTPNFKLLSIGWFTTAFSIIHLYPEALLDFVTKKLVSKKNESL